jgi:hypothetical protein
MIKRTLIVLAVTLFSLVGAEIIARFLGPPDIEVQYSEYLKAHNSLTPLPQKLEDDLQMAEKNLFGFNDAAKRPHPFLGHVYNDALDSRANRDGFRDPHEFPYKKQEGEFVIGVFGGSVAKNFATFELFREGEKKENLISRLKEKFPNLLGNKKLVLLNFAVAAYRQPQQLISTILYIDTIDMAINIDGYNEVMMEQHPSHPIYFPHYANIFFSKDPAQHGRWAEIYVIKKGQINLTEKFIRGQWLKKSGLVYLYWTWYISRTDQKMIVADKNASGDLDYKHPYYRKSEMLSMESLAQENAKNWRRFLQLQHLLLEARHIPHFFFLQPNQYVPNSKILSIVEKEKFYRPDLLVSIDLLTVGYKEMRTFIPQMAAQGIPIFDLTMIFKNRDDTLYNDHCCHFNYAGDSGLEDAIFERMSTHWKTKK